ncbi:hypothetical protein ATCC90586_004913 [Pythium insidiosum]|nr:hypothetical protein ATCC90586_004913 [Pythium insidiosum]
MSMNESENPTRSAFTSNGLVHQLFRVIKLLRQVELDVLVCLEIDLVVRASIILVRPAFLMFKAQRGGWGSVDVAGQWDRWSMAEDTQPIGKLEHWKGGRLEFSVQQQQLVLGNGNGHCGYFQYVYPDDELSPADAMPLKLGRLRRMQPLSSRC